MAAKSDTPDRAAPGRPPIAPARAVVLTSLIQLVPVAVNLRLRHRRSLRAIERNLADSDPSPCKGTRPGEVTPEIEAGRGFWYPALCAAKED